MNYRFEISKPDSSNFRCEIAIDGDQTFQQLHDKIVETLDFDPSQIASFFASDKMGNRGREIALMDMTTGEEDEEESTLVMDVTMIREVINPHCLELEYVYDFFSNRYLKVEYAGEYHGDSSVVFPVCVYCEGELPQQTDYDDQDKWAFDKEEDDYDDSFMEEFGGGSNYRSRGSKYDDEDDYRFDEEEEGDYEDEYGGFDDRYESLDDYIDKL